MRAQAICEHKLIYSYICVLVLLYVCVVHAYICPHNAIYVSRYYYMCPHTTVYVCAYYFVSGWARDRRAICEHNLLYVCHRTTTCVLIPLYMCPHFTVCVRILLYMSSYYYVSSYYYMCPHTTILIRGRGSVKHADVCWRMLTYANVC